MSEEESKKSGLYCFLNDTRPCSAECMAYLSESPPGKDFQGQQFSHCLVLVNIQRTGKHLVVIANELGLPDPRTNIMPPPVK